MMREWVSQCFSSILCLRPCHWACHFFNSSTQVIALSIRVARTAAPSSSTIPAQSRSRQSVSGLWSEQPTWFGVVLRIGGCLDYTWIWFCLHEARVTCYFHVFSLWVNSLLEKMFVFVPSSFSAHPTSWIVLVPGRRTLSQGTIEHTKRGWATWTFGPCSGTYMEWAIGYSTSQIR